LKENVVSDLEKQKLELDECLKNHDQLKEEPTEWGQAHSCLSQEM
jgi:hypothetical protein